MIKKYILFICLTFLISTIMTEAYAKRLGSGKSLGRQSSMSSIFQKKSPRADFLKSSPANNIKNQTKKFGMQNVLKGLLAGLGLAWLFSHFGVMGTIGSFVLGILLIFMISMIFFLLLKKFSKRFSVISNIKNNYIDSSFVESHKENLQKNVFKNHFNKKPVDDISDIDKEMFIENSKKHFLLLQEAWDIRDLEKIREFTTSKMYSELEKELLLSKKNNPNQQTIVLTLHADLIEFKEIEEEEIYQANVHFSGMIRENVENAAQSFSEIWILIKSMKKGGWVLSGITQVNQELIQ